MTGHGSFFHSRQQLLGVLSSLYVLGLIVSHAALPSQHVWIIAAFFSIIMNGTYVIEAVAQRRMVGIESGVALLLISASVLGVFIHPIFVIAAIFAHGIWDLAKHAGAGVPFLSWYTLGCFVVDVSYSAVLVAYLMTI